MSEMRCFPLKNCRRCWWNHYQEGWFSAYCEHPEVDGKEIPYKSTIYVADDNLGIFPDYCPLKEIKCTKTS